MLELKTLIKIQNAYFLCRDFRRKMINQPKLLARISINPNIRFGKPCIKGHRIWVSLILDFLASGMTIAELIEEYPQLQVDDIYACIAYGAEMSRERYVDIPLEQSA
jgi:uncharacterized protein (DUF433 family)